jgi:outer membrane biosynthesis protein TonB
MTKAEMHAFEKAMMDDPMLSDAVDGYSKAKESSKNQLEAISEKLKAAPAKVVKGSFKQWMSVAAVLVMLLSASVVLYRIFNSNNSNNQEIVATTEPEKQKTVEPLEETIVDSNSVAINEKVTDQPALPKPVIIPPVSKQKQLEKEAVAADETNNVTISKKDAVAQQPSAPPMESAESRSSVQDVTVAQKQKAEPVKLNKFIGRIVDESNNPLPFVNITEKNSGVGTYADVNGNFVLLSTDSVLNVQTRSMGYLSSTAQLKGNTVQKITLKDEEIVAKAPTKETFYERDKKRLDKENADSTDEVLAAPVDGWSNYNVYLQNNMRSNEPESFNKNRRETKEVLLVFDVNPDGSLTNIKVQRSNCKSCNNEAIRLLKEGPGWKSKTGKKESSRFTIKF